MASTAQEDQQWHGRLDFRLVNRSTGKLVLADQVTPRAADLSEDIAGRVMGIRILEHFAETLPVETPAPKQEKTP